MAGLIVEVFGDDASGDNRAALMSSGELRPLKDHRRVNAGEEREAPGIGWESSKSKGASALKIRCSVYIGYFELSNRVDTLILNQGCYRRGASEALILSGRAGMLDRPPKARRVPPLGMTRSGKQIPRLRCVPLPFRPGRNLRACALLSPTSLGAGLMTIQGWDAGEGEARGFPIGHEARRGALTKPCAGVNWRFIFTGIGGSHGVEVVGGKQGRRQRQRQR